MACNFLDISLSVSGGQPLPSSSYVTTGDADSSYDSVLNGSETAASTVQLRCTATITVNGNSKDSSTTTLTVSGENPAQYFV